MEIIDVKHCDVATDPASFRDPSGFVYEYNGYVYRTVAQSYAANYDKLLKSGLYNVLSSNELLLPHEEVDNIIQSSSPVYKTLKYVKIPFVSYPYEWTFSMLKNAAKCFLKIALLSLQYGMLFKDASAFNIQFYKGKPIMIDTLSFEELNERMPWKAYGQFCRHFLAPLAFGTYNDQRLIKLFQAYIDGLPLDLASDVLPLPSYLKMGLLFHIHLHSKTTSKTIHKLENTKQKTIFSKKSIQNILENLYESIDNMRSKKIKTLWSSYRESHQYSQLATKSKLKIISEWLSNTKRTQIIDIGCNDGFFSLIASKYADFVVAIDYDINALETFYAKIQKDTIENVIPLYVDITNPTPNIGWHLKERKSFIERIGNNNTLLALAVIHHLAIGNNIPLIKVLEFFADISSEVILEFVPKSDKQVAEMLKFREDIFEDYTLDNLISISANKFNVKEVEKIHDSERTLLWLVKK